MEYDDYMLKNNIQNKDSDVYIDEYEPAYGGNLISFEVSKHFEYSLIKTEEEIGYINGVRVGNLHLCSVQSLSLHFLGIMKIASVKI